MQLPRAIEILERLRDGDDPLTGRPLPEGSPGPAPDLVRALYTVLAALPVEDAAVSPDASPAAPPRRPQPARAGRPWTDDEDARLAAAFDAGESAGKLAQDHGRSAAAIRMRLVKLGRLGPDEAPPGRMRQAAPATLLG